MPELELPKPDEIEEQKADQFTRNVAMTVAVYAVALAIASLGGNNVSKEMMLAQQQASDQWAFYQAKAIREKQCELELAHLEFEVAERGESMSPTGRTAADTLREKLIVERDRYAQEKPAIKAQAEELEHERDVNRLKDPFFDYAEVLLQISVVVASVAMLGSSRRVFYFSLVLAGLGGVLTVNGFVLVVRHLPLLGTIAGAGGA